MMTLRLVTVGFTGTFSSSCMQSEIAGLASGLRGHYPNQWTRCARPAGALRASVGAARLNRNTDTKRAVDKSSVIAG